MNKFDILKPVILAGGLALYPACSSHEDCQLISNDRQAEVVIGSPVDDNVCNDDLMKACANFKALVCIVSPESYNSNLEKRNIGCGTASTGSDIANMCEHSDVSLCYATNNPDAIAMTCND